MITRTELKTIASLRLRKHRDESRQFLVEGVRSLQEAGTSSHRVDTVLYTEEFAGEVTHRGLLASLKQKGARLEQVTSKILSGITDTEQSQGIIGVVAQQQIQPAALLAPRSAGSIIAAADAVADPGNLGSMIRSCDWFGIQGVVLGNGCVDLYNPKVVRGTMGSLFHLPVAEHVDLPAFLAQAQSHGYAIATTGADGTMTASGPGRIVVVFGNEAHGISSPVEELATMRLGIPRIGKAESLNVGTACGIILAALTGMFDRKG